MAGTSLLTLIDDIATALDDLAVMTKVAMKKTAGVLGDDLALNAEQVIGIHAHRELPIVWAVAKGSAVNKLILVPLALVISFFLPPLVTILLMLGGLYLCYEGFEKIIKKMVHEPHEPLGKEQNWNNIDMDQFEKDKIKGAVRTDFVLSAEIIIITLGTVASSSISKQIAVLTLISCIMTVGVYGLVAFIVKLDDLGFILRDKRPPFRYLGLLLINAAPSLMKFLSIAGTAAMFLVGGGIIAHGIPWIHHHTEHLSALWSLGINLGIGIAIGGLAVALHFAFHKILHSRNKAQ